MTNQVVEQTITGQYHKGITQFHFNVGSHAQWVAIQFEMEKPFPTIHVMDANQQVRLQYLYGNTAKTIVIHQLPEQSSYSTVPGFIPEGEWMIEILGRNTHQLKFHIVYGLTEQLPEGIAADNGNGRFWLNPLQENDRSFVLNRYDWETPRERKQRWYRGDFHTHTTMTDGKMSTEFSMQQAVKQNLDFFIATDHNIIPTVWCDSEVLVIPGMEVTADIGHFNVIGAKEWIDFRVSCEDGGMSTEAGMNRVLREAGESGALRSINHPLVHPWAWLFRETDLSQVDMIEVWNDPTYPSNVYGTELGLSVWTCLWNDGWLIPGIGGSDVHHLPTDSYEENGLPSVIGDPATCVFAEELSPNAILQATKRGRVYVTRGPVIDADIQVNGQTVQFGDCVTDVLHSAEQAMDQANKMTVQYRVHISGLAQGEVYWVENGERKDAQSIQGDGWHQCTFDWSPVEFRWRRMEIRDVEGKLLAFTNPIYCGSKRPNFSTWGPYYDLAYVPEPEKQS